jgi:hypothetical protein
MLIQFTLHDLVLFLLFILGSGVGILLLLVLLKTKKTLISVRSLIETNKESINKTIKTMPGTFENIGQISVGIREATNKLKVSVPVILQDVESLTNAAKASIGGETAIKKDEPAFMSYFYAIEEVLHIIARVFPSEK